MSLTFSIDIGEILKWKDTNYRITHFLNLNMVLGLNVKNGESTKLPISELEPATAAEKKAVEKSEKDLSNATDEEWAVVEKRLEIIRPLLSLGKERTQEDVQKVADANKVGIATVYRWIASMEATGRPSSLLRSGRSDSGSGRIDKVAEHIISEVIENYYLTENKPTISQTHEQLKTECDAQGIKPPSIQTLSRRIRRLMPKESAKQRLGKEATLDYSSSYKQYSEATAPLSVVQIDHTPVDLQFVDERYREPIGRAWLTVAIDVWSRCVCGFYLSYDAPSAASVGFALTHSILPKEKFLTRLGIDEKWNIWGLIHTIHADNGSDFRCHMIDRACLEYGIHMNWRPKSKPNYGGHIERLLGTFNKDIHQLPGSTFSNVKERGRYKSEKEATFTISEFEKWLTIYISKIYHQRLHRSLNTSPIAKLQEGYLGTDESPGLGYPPMIKDEKRLKLDFLPGVHRTVQRYGVAINDIFYYSNLISKYIKFKDRSSNNNKKFLVKQDPRDISVAYFYDDQTNEYIDLMISDRTIGSMSLADLKMAKKRLKDKGIESIDERKIFRAYRQLLELTKETIERSKSAKRNNEKRKESSKNNKDYFIESDNITDEIEQLNEDELFKKERAGFDEIEFDDL